MKILFLNPHLYDSPIIGVLRKLGVAAIVCSDLKECELVSKLHATSISLFVGHDDEGVAMNEILKKNPRFAATPVILTTSRWNERQCVQHQSGPFGANAYLRMPVDDKEFVHVIDQILGTRLSHGQGFNLSDDLSVIAPSEAHTQTGISLAIIGQNGIEIEDAGLLYGQSGEISAVPIDPDLELKFDLPGEGGQNFSVATPIEATSPDVAPSFVGTFGAALDPEGPTFVAMPIPPSDPVPETTAGSSTSSEELDPEALATMPYLGSSTAYPNPLAYREPMDDAVVPGGAANAPDVETLKKYLYLREQDVTALSAQLRQSREQIGLLEGQLRQERAISSEFAHLAQEQDRRIDGFDKEKSVALEAAQKEYDDLKFEMKRRSEKIRVMELQVREATEATERLKERVRSDIRKIRTREKELENRLEIMKKDSEALLGSREQKIIELKRKLDLLEFNTDLVQDLLEKERRTTTELRDKLAKAAQMMRVAGGLLGPNTESEISGVADERTGTAA